MPTFEEQGLPDLSRTVLVVEDNETMRTMLAELLGETYRVICAKDGAEGIELLRDDVDHVSLVMLDVYMPVLDGFEFLRLRQADERLSNVPVIVTTASGSVEDEIRCLKLGANDVVIKPYNAEVILNRAANIIRLRESASIVNELRWDRLTGLYREEFFYWHVEGRLAAFPDTRFDIVVSDIRNLKMLNDRYGRSACDKLLKDLAWALERTIPGIVASGRVGDDSFAFLIEHADPAWTQDLDGAVRSLALPHLNVRFGIVPDVDHSLPASQLVGRCDIALQELKEGVGVAVALYDDALRKRRATERMLIESMADGLGRNEFEVYYQPKHEASTGQVAGAEALVRWLHPELGFVRPDVFVPLFERTGMIAELDRFVRHEVLREIARLKELELPVVPISVNVSPLDFDDETFVDDVVEATDHEGVEHELLHLELTETAYVEDPEDVVRALQELRAEGYKIELDDFGSGYSSLALLNVLPLDIVKVDGAMVRNATRIGDFRIIQSAIQIARLLGLETIVEGVETDEALERLREMGCDLVQGFTYSWPLRRRDFEAYLLEH